MPHLDRSGTGGPDDEAQLPVEHRRADLHGLLQGVLREEHPWNWTYQLPGFLAEPLAALDRFVATGEPLGDVEKDVRGLLDRLTRVHLSASELAPIRARLLRALGSKADLSSIVGDGDDWGKELRAWLLLHWSLAWPPLLAHLATASGVEPSQKWRRQTAELLKAPGAEELIRYMVDSSFQAEIRNVYGSTFPSAFHESNAGLVRGAYWAADVGDWPWVAETLGRAGLRWGLSGRNNNTARDQRLATTCAALLGGIGTFEALMALGRMKAKVRNRPVRKAVETALAKASARAGTSPSELLELAVPRFGLDANGRKETPVADSVAILSLVTDGAALTWGTSAGGEVASPPKSAVGGDPDGVKAAKADLKELRAAVSVERGRIEEMLVEGRSWPYAVWRERYLEHPLTAVFARRLIWHVAFDGGTCTAIPLEGRLIDMTGSALEPPPDNATVRLWHPIDAAAQEVRRWRDFVLKRHVRQPFKQAFREVYRLTPAEEETGVYSNRFGGHILNYPVARALMGTRRWVTNFLGPFDGGFEGIAKHDFAVHGLRAEFYHDAIVEDEAYAPVTRCSTDQVRFLARAGRGRVEPVPLRDVPTVVFSEAMRDVDLFVSVASMAADTNWRDTGLDHQNVLRQALVEAAFAAAHARQYADWHESAFGELTGSAESRREVLAWMLPQFAVADRLELDDRWLRVRGDLRSYKIHLGSGNILMEPNDEYLCIVPARGADTGVGEVFLPFDDDTRLSTILSKAFMLAKDREITDATILAQLEHGLPRGG